MTQNRVRFRFPRSVRVICSDDFGRLLRSSGPGSIRLGRDLISVCAQTHEEPGRVRFGFTVGKHNAPRSVDRALVKRVMRECSRLALPEIASICAKHDVGIDISLRLRGPIKDVGRSLPVDEAKRLVRKGTQLCLSALRKRLNAVIQEAKNANQNPGSAS
ncbi:MAG: ribonuclease P protein component [Duodenibacillus sp.]|nr:ribonuclease P protein component [Duodenibacillus sp.]